MVILKCELYREINLKQHRKYNTPRKTSKRDFYWNKISENIRNQKELYMLIKRLVPSKVVDNLP